MDTNPDSATSPEPQPNAIPGTPSPARVPLEQRILSWLSRKVRKSTADVHLVVARRDHNLHVLSTYQTVLDDVTAQIEAERTFIAETHAADPHAAVAATQEMEHRRGEELKRIAAAVQAHLVPHPAKSPS